MNKIKIIVMIIIFLFAPLVYGADYYIDGASGNDSNVGTIASPWETIGKANATLQAGDTVYIRGGVSDYQIYYVGKIDTLTEGIHPKNSGTDADHRITYAVYPGEKVHFIGNANTSWAIKIDGKDWIKVTGYDGSTSAQNFKFSNFYNYLWLYDGKTATPYQEGADYCEISYCEFTATNNAVISNTNYRLSTIQHNSDYNWIHHCTFSQMGGYTGSDIGVSIEIGFMDCGYNTNGICSDSSTHNVLEDCEFYHAGHHTIGVMENHNVIRNNRLHNEQWYEYAVDGITYGYRVIAVGGEYNTNYHHGYNLFEGNEISHATNNPNSSLGGAGIHLSSSNNIIRYNDFYANAGNSIILESHTATTTGRMNYNHIYNNTFFANGYGATFPNATNPLTREGPNWRGSPPDRSPFYFVSGGTGAIFATSLYGNAVKNNLAWNNYGEFAVSGMYNDGWDFDNCDGYGVCGDTVFANNWVDANGDPKFTSEGDYGSPTIPTTDWEWYWYLTKDTPPVDITASLNQPDFTLQANSGAIDQGTYLTQAKFSGSNERTLYVDDAKYFQDGWGHGAGGGAYVAADYIAIGTITNTVQIDSIDYANNKITLKNAKTWSAGAHIWLYKDSDGTIVLNGAAPDQGAHEYIISGPQTISAPQNLQISN